MSNEKIEAFWQDATAEDVAGMMKGQTVEVRVRDHLQEDWSKTVWLLAGYDSTEENSWIDNTGCPWRYCQVYREPSWWTKKPDPGPGFRLLEKFPDEELKPGDEAWDMWNDKKWAGSHNASDGKPQSEDIWYRRRIEPVEPVEHYLGKVEAIKQFIVGDTFWHPNGLLLKITEKGFEVAQ
jgi:hypothetical protein